MVDKVIGVAVDRREERLRSTPKKRHPEYILIPLVFLGVVALIEFVIIPAFHIERWLFPKPSLVFKTLVEQFRPTLWPELKVTLVELGLGYLIGAPLGILMAMIITQFDLVEKVVSPYILTLVVTPIVALVPLLIIMFGFGVTTKIIVVIIAAFPPVMMNSIVGFKTTDELKLDLMKSLNASTFKTFWMVRFPNALPTIFTGLILALVGSLVSVVAAEFVGGTQGLGYVIVYSASILRTEMLFATVLLLAIMGIAAYQLISLVQRLVVRW